MAVAGTEVLTRLGPLLVRPAGARRIDVGLPHGARLVVNRIDHELLSAQVHLTPTGWRCGIHESGVFRPWGGMSLVRAGGARASDSATRQVRQLVGEVASGFAAAHPDQLGEAEAARLERISAEGARLIEHLEARADLVRRCVAVATSGAPAEVDGYEAARFLADGESGAGLLGVEVYRRPSGYRLMIVPAGAEPPAGDWEPLRR